MTNSLRSSVAAFAIVLAAWVGTCGATIVEIDDTTEPISVSINGVPITSAGQNVGTFPDLQEVTGFVLFPAETVLVRWTDHSITGAPTQQFNSPRLFLIEPDTGAISNIITLFIQGFDTFTHFAIQMESDLGGTGLTCAIGCVSLGEATGEFQDISAAALGNSGVSGLTIRVRADIDPTVVPEPATLLLVLIALAVFPGRQAWRLRRAPS